jgi:hypothetical protein
VLNSTLDRYISKVSVSIFTIDQKKFGKDEVAIESYNRSPKFDFSPAPYYAGLPDSERNSTQRN